jgi:hypothetical protein
MSLAPSVYPDELVAQRARFAPNVYAMDAVVHAFWDGVAAGAFVTLVVCICVGLLIWQVRAGL